MSVVEIIKHYQRSIEQNAGNLKRLLQCVTKLYSLPITVQHLQDTGVGRTVNGLRKYKGDCGEAAKSCVAKWKTMVAAEDSSDAETEDVDRSNGDYGKDTGNAEKSHSSSSNKEKSSSKSKKIVSLEDIRPAEDVNDHYGSVKVKERTAHSSSRRESDTERRERKAESSSSSSSQRKSVDYNDRKSRVDDKSRNLKKLPSEEQSYQKKSRDDKISTPKRSEVEDQSYERKSREENSNSTSKKSTSEDRSKRKIREEHLPESNKKHKPKSTISDDSADDSPVSTERHRKQSKEIKSPSKSKHPKSDSSLSRSDNKPSKTSKSRDEKGMSGIKTEDGSIDCLSGASFGEALGMINPKHRRSSPSSSFSSPNTSFSSPNYSPYKSSSPSKSGSALQSSPSKSSGSSSKKTETSSPIEFDFMSSTMKLEPLDMEVPAINLNYRPLPNTFNPFDSPPQKKPKGLTDEEALSQIMYQKNERTRVYSGVKGAGFRRGAVPSLFDSCIRVLQDNIDALGYTGGVPFDILEPVLRRATPDQLLELEHHNPYLVEDTDPLWEFHCKKQFRSMSREEMESYREMFLRGLDERAAKFEALKSNIKQAQAASMPVRKAKMTYMDSVAKPPREVARQQARNGTARPQPPGASCRSISTAAPRAQSLPKKRTVAPLMQKTMKFAKTFKR